MLSIYKSRAVTNNEEKLVKLASGEIRVFILDTISSFFKSQYKSCIMLVANISILGKSGGEGTTVRRLSWKINYS